MTGFQWAEALASPVVIGAGCLVGFVLIAAIVRWLYRESDPNSWLENEPLDLPPSISELIMKDQARQAHVVPIRRTQLPRFPGATK